MNSTNLDRHLVVTSGGKGSQWIFCDDLTVSPGQPWNERLKRAGGIDADAFDLSNEDVADASRTEAGGVSSTTVEISGKLISHLESVFLIAPRNGERVALEDGSAIKTEAGRGDEMGGDAHGTSRLTKDGHAGGITTEGSDVVLGPLKRISLIHDSVVALQIGGMEESQGTEAIVDYNEDHTSGVHHEQA